MRKTVLRAIGLIGFCWGILYFAGFIWRFMRGDGLIIEIPALIYAYLAFHGGIALMSLKDRGRKLVLILSGLFTINLLLLGIGSLFSEDPRIYLDLPGRQINLVEGTVSVLGTLAIMGIPFVLAIVYLSSKASKEITYAGEV